MNTRAQRGVTLLELLTAITVLAILLGVAVPAFTGMARANQIAAESNVLMASLATARSESMKRGVPVSVCASGDQATCATTPDWNAGWILFEDRFGVPGTVDPSDVVLDVWQGPTNGVVVVGGAPVTFMHTGRAEFARTFDVSKSGCGANERRVIGVAMSGRVSLTRSNC